MIQTALSVTMDGVEIEYCLFRLLLLQCEICLLVILLVLALGQGRLFNCKLSTISVDRSCVRS